MSTLQPPRKICTLINLLEFPDSDLLLTEGDAKIFLQRGRRARHHNCNRHFG